ncbi:MAG: tryptophan--tRNA ligase, partial [Betaproteobacteria bacterium]
CPVWQFHQVYSSAETREWVWQGCTTAGIGCLECKQPVIDAILAEQKPWRERAAAYLANPKQVHWIVEVGTERARTIARETMREVREAMGLSY